MNAIWTPMGLDSLNETTRFIEEQWNEVVANQFLERLDERIEQLKKNPRIGPIYKRTEFRQLLIHPNVTVYYTVEADLISLVLAWANKQDPDELKRRLKRM